MRTVREIYIFKMIMRSADYDDDEDDNNSCHTVLTNNQWGHYCNEYRGKPIRVNKGKQNNDEHTRTHPHTMVNFS